MTPTATVAATATPTSPPAVFDINGDGIDDYLNLKPDKKGGKIEFSDGTGQSFSIPRGSSVVSIGRAKGISNGVVIVVQPDGAGGTNWLAINPLNPDEAQVIGNITQRGKVLAGCFQDGYTNPAVTVGKLRQIVVSNQEGESHSFAPPKGSIQVNCSSPQTNGTSVVHSLVQARNGRVTVKGVDISEGSEVFTSPKLKDSAGAGILFSLPSYDGASRPSVVYKNGRKYEMAILNNQNKWVKLSLPELTGKSSPKSVVAGVLSEDVLWINILLSNGQYFALQIDKNSVT